MARQSIGVIGAGIIGIAVAREIALRFPSAEVVVFEKESTLAAHQTGHNSGVVHAGLYYQPGGLKAQLCRRGVTLLKDVCHSHGVAYKECGKIVVARKKEEETRLRTIFERAKANGVPDVQILGSRGIKEIEPNAIGRVALHSPHTAIVDYREVTRALANEIGRAGVDIRLATEVVNISHKEGKVAVYTRTYRRDFDFVVACAGLQADRIAQMAGGKRNPQIVPFFGQYSVLEPRYKDVINGLVYPVPDPAYPFLGVHVSKRIDGETIVGPNAFLSFGRESYSGRQVDVSDSVNIGTNLSFWRFAVRNIRPALRELSSVASRKRFMQGAAAYVPSLSNALSTPITRGIRAQAIDIGGTLLDDFAIEHLGRLTVVRNAPSPGATSALAISEHIVNEMVRAHPADWGSRTR